MGRKHALVVGGTGMLSDVTLWLNKKGYIVSVIGRRNETYQKLITKADKPKHIHSILVDYHDSKLLKEKLLDRVNKDGSFDLIVSWVHSSAPLANSSIIEVQYANPKMKAFEFYHIKSSSSYFEDIKIDVGPKGSYHEVFLGFKLINTRSRWLTHQEISEGVKDSIHHRRVKTIVGQVEPWDLRPH